MCAPAPSKAVIVKPTIPESKHRDDGSCMYVYLDFGVVDAIPSVSSMSLQDETVTFYGTDGTVVEYLRETVYLVSRERIPPPGGS